MIVEKFNNFIQNFKEMKILKSFKRDEKNRL